jgi:hypothetical protein
MVRSAVPSSSPPHPTPAERRDAPAFYGLCALLWGFFCLMAYFTPVLLDDWYQVAWHQRHSLTLATLWSYARYDYFNYNPRLGENFLLLVNGPAAIHLLLTPTVELTLLFAMFALAYGRWPRATRGDALKLLLGLVLVWLAVPIPGVMFFYRPFTTNYVYAFCLQVLLFVPYRFAFEPGAATKRAVWFVPLMFLLGWCVGMTNEHTGPTEIVALAAILFVFWKQRRAIHAWMWAGLVGIVVGYPMLFFAPGQSLRYGGLATKASPLETIADRGADGTAQIIIDFVTETMLGLVFVLIAVLVAYNAERRRRAAGDATPGLLRVERTHLATMLPFLVAATTIVLTLFASPVVGERTFFAPAALCVCAFLVLIDVLMREPRARRYLALAATVVFGWHAVQLVLIYPRAKAENDARMAIVRAARPGGIAYVPPYSHFNRSRYFLGDDMTYASLREYVAHEVFGKGGIEYTKPLRSEPTAQLTMSVEPTMDPPMAAADVLAQLEMPLSYLPSYVDREIQLVRRIDDGLKSIPGHRFVSVETPVHGLDLPLLRGRPLLGVRWDGKDLTFIDGRRLVDKMGLPYFLLWRGTVPPGLTDAYVVSCGKTEQVPMTKDPDGKGLRMTYVPRCRGHYLAIACTEKECWLAAATWR